MKIVVLGFLTLGIWTVLATDQSKGNYYILKVDIIFRIDRKIIPIAKVYLKKILKKICKIKRFTILNTMYVNPLEIFCHFAGKIASRYGYQFKIDDLNNSLQRCTAFVYGQYYFDRFSGKSDTKLTTQVLEADKGIRIF